MKTENTTATKNLLAASGMKIKSNIKAGGWRINHNQTVANHERH